MSKEITRTPQMGDWASCISSHEITHYVSEIGKNVFFDVYDINTKVYTGICISMSFIRDAIEKKIIVWDDKYQLWVIDCNFNGK